MKNITRRTSLLAGISLLTAFMAVTQAFATLVTVTVKNSAGSPLAGVAVRYKGSLSGNVAYPMGSTSVDGTVTKDLAAGSWAFDARYAQTDSAWTPLQDITVDADAEFQTSAITVEVKTCAGVPIKGAGTEYRTVLTQPFYTFGSTDVGGKVSRELFPGSYTFLGRYNQTKLAPAYHVTQDVAANPLVKLTTTKVTLNYSGSIKYKGVDSTPIWPFSKPSMEMFAGPNTFKFDYAGGSTLVAVEVSGCEFSRTMLQLISSTGAGLAGGVAEYSDYGSIRGIPGTTGPDGYLLANIPSLPSGHVTKIRMKYNKGVEDKAVTGYVLAPPYVWQTKAVTLWTKDNIGNALPNILINANSGWGFRQAGSTDAAGKLVQELLNGASGPGPQTYAFQVYVNAGANSWFQWSPYLTPPATYIFVKP